MAGMEWSKKSQQTLSSWFRRCDQNVIKHSQNTDFSFLQQRTGLNLKGVRF